MPIVVSCSACRRKVKVREALLGRKVRCPVRGEAFLARTEADGDVADEPRDQCSTESGDDTYAIQSEASPAAPSSRRRDDGSPRRRCRPASALTTWTKTCVAPERSARRSS